MSEDNKVVEMEERKELVEGGSEPREDFAPAPDDEEESSEGLKVNIGSETITVSDGDRFVKGKKNIDIVTRDTIRLQREMGTIEEVTVGGKNNDGEVKLRFKENLENVAKKKPKYKVWANYLIDWSSNEEISLRNVKRAYDIEDLLDKFLEEIYRVNNISKKDEQKN